MGYRNGHSVTAVVLAAGRGSRLAEVTDHQPKCLVKIGSRPLLQIQLQMLETAGIDDIVVVAGYRSEQVSRAVEGRASVIVNADWASSNSLYSLSLARGRIPGGLLLINGDVLAHPRALTRVLQSQGDAFAYDSSSGGEEEHMKIQMDGEYLRAMRKDLPAERVHGENLGLLFFTQRTAAILLDVADALLDDGGRSEWAPAAVERTARRVPLRGVDVSDLPWIEIDFPQDLDRARREVWPRLHRALTATHGDGEHFPDGRFVQRPGSRAAIAVTATSGVGR